MGRGTPSDREADVELTTIGVAPDGDAFARDSNGRPIFVRGAIPGEKVRVELLIDRRQYAKASVLEVIDPSPHRTLPPCPEVLQGCGACTWQHIGISEQEHLKTEIVESALRREGRHFPGGHPCAIRYLALSHNDSRHRQGRPCWVPPLTLS